MLVKSQKRCYLRVPGRHVAVEIVLPPKHPLTHGAGEPQLHLPMHPHPVGCHLLGGAEAVLTEAARVLVDSLVAA